MLHQLTLKQIRKFILILAVFLLVGGSGWWLRGRWEARQVGSGQAKIVNYTNDQKEIDFGLFWQVWRKLEEKYLERASLDKKKMFYGAIQGLTASLGDPYTVFLPPKENKETKENLNGSFEGVGIQLGFNEQEQLVVIAPLKGMPAEELGVRAGDLVLHIKDETKGFDEDLVGLSLPGAVEKIRGPKGTKVSLTLLHEGESQPYTIEIVRETIVVPSVEIDFVDDGKVAHLKLLRFGDLTAEQWEKAVNEIIAQRRNLKGMILDVRGNPGGYLKGSITFASEFLAKGTVVKQEDYRGEVETYSVNRKGRLLDIPLVVLIDRGSASASEILAGALHDQGRAKLVGTRSFGKGTIQEAEDLGDGAGLHITTAKWLTPNGEWVNKKGLKPDFEVQNDPKNPDEDEQLQKAIELLTSNN